MWPRSEEEKARARHCGFVAFVNRKDAAAAKDDLNEIELRGHVMRIGWGKAVAKPSPALTLASIQVTHGTGRGAHHLPPLVPCTVFLTPSACPLPLLASS